MNKFCPFIKGTCLMNQCCVYDENGQLCSFARLDYLPDIALELSALRYRYSDQECIDLGIYEGVKK